MDRHIIKQAFEKKGYDFSGKYIPYKFDMQEYMSRYDVVFRTPMKQAFEALPIGNGDVAAMIWNTDECLCMQINKCDLWSQPDGESPLLLRSAARVKIDFGMPCFDYLYLDDFDSRLCISNAEAKFYSSAPFAEVSAAAYADTDRNLIVVELESKTGDFSTIRISLERYGSRSYAGWYHSVYKGAEKGLGMAKTGVRDDTAWMLERFDGTGSLSCAVAMTVLEPGAVIKNINGRRTEFTVDSDGYRKVSVLISAASSHESDDPLSRAFSVLDEGRADFASIRSRKNEWWKDFWNRSYVHLSKEGREPEFEYLANVYYIQQYMMGIGSRGKYLMTFNAGTFTWNRDVRQWVNPHHWNTQQAYWAVQASNHPELMVPYINTYTRIRPQAEKYALDTFGISGGVVISEMHDFEGRMLAYKYTLTPAAQIAMHFWEHYLYNGDEDYLREVAYPFIAGCANTYAYYAEYNESTGKYDIGPASPYETDCDLQLYNTTVDAVMSRYILSAALKAAAVLGIKDEKTARWKDVLDNIFDFVYERSYGFPDKAPEYLALGLSADDRTVVPGNGGFARNASPLMPAAIIGSRDKGTRLYRAVESAVSSYQRHILAITPKACLETRLGRGDAAVDTMFDMIDQLQHFPQGLFYNIDHWHIYSRYVASHDKVSKADGTGLQYPFSQRDYMYDAMCEYDNITIRVPGGAEGIVETPTQPFVQCGFESPGIITHALNELSMQSYEGVIRVYPSFSGGYRGSFTLKAAGGFMVTGGCTPDGTAKYIIIKSLLGNRCFVEVPFPDAVLCGLDGSDIESGTDENGYTVFMTEAGKTYLIYGGDLSEDDIIDMNIPMYTNNDWRHFRNARIGSKRQF